MQHAYRAFSSNSATSDWSSTLSSECNDTWGLEAGGETDFDFDATLSNDVLIPTLALLIKCFDWAEWAADTVLVFRRLKAVCLQCKGKKSQSFPYQTQNNCLKLYSKILYKQDTSIHFDMVRMYDYVCRL